MELLPLDALISATVKARIERLLNGEKIVLVKANWPWQQSPWNQVAFFEDPQAEIDFYACEYNLHAQAAARGFDNLPFFRVDFGRVAYLMSIAYGCQAEKINHLINSRPRITRAEDLETISKPGSIQERGLYPAISERMLAIEKRFGPVPFVPSDVQSPIDVLTTIVQSDVCMVAMFEQPEVLHRILAWITESIAEIVHHQKGLVTNWLGSGHDYPITRGIHLSDDAAAYLSPATYREFEQPYTERLADAFQGVTLHCCMKYQQNLKVMASARGFLGFDPQIAYNAEGAILDAVRGKGFWRIHHLPNGIDAGQYYQGIIDRTEGVCGLMIEVYGDSMTQALALADQIRDYAARKGRS